MARCGVRPVVLMPELAQPRQAVEHQPGDVDHVVPGGRLAAGDVRVLDVLPELRLEGLVDLLEAHVRLAVARASSCWHISQRASQTKVQ